MENNHNKDLPKKKPVVKEQIFGAWLLLGGIVVAVVLLKLYLG